MFDANSGTFRDGSGFEPDDVKNKLLDVFDMIPADRYKEKAEKLVEENRPK